jgi:hypothetical protein
LDSGAGFDQCASSLGAAIKKLEKCAVIRAKSGAEVEIEQSAQNPDYLLASALLELGMGNGYGYPPTKEKTRAGH